MVATAALASAGGAEGRDLFAEADLVKFARVRPSPEVAAALLEGAHALLADWHDATAPAQAPPELEDALT